MKPKQDPERLFERTRTLRREPTAAELAMWRELRDRRLAGFKFRRQHPAYGYVVDFYCDEAKLVVEVDGGGHAMQEQSEFDEARTRTLEQNGLRVLRFWNTDVMKNLDGVLETIVDALCQLMGRSIEDEGPQEHRP